MEQAHSCEALWQARRQFIQREPLEASVRPTVLDAWQRCRAGGISPRLNSAPRITGPQLDHLLAQNASLISVAEPLLRRLYQFLRGFGFAVTLSDRHGYLLCVIGDDDVLCSTNGNMDVGADWGEAHVGNNSVGTPLIEDKPLQFWGFEHYTKLPQRWAGSGCPIHHSDGSILGGISISGPVEGSHRHTLGMAVMTAQAIEMQIKLKEALDYTNLVNQHQETIINSISEGMLIINAQGEVSLVNDFVLKYIKTTKEQLLGTKIQELFTDINLLSSIQANEAVTDYITTLVFQNGCYNCTVTCRKIGKASDSPETLVLIGELMRAKTLAQRINTNDALLTFNDIIGEDLQLSSMIRFAKVAAETSANVLILGESGTGKEVFAQAIHSGSLRKNGPFIAVNCGAIPKELITSTLFGYEEGAFTGAKRGGSPGKFELADKGTLFLDEIGELPLDVQAVLLRVLDQKTFTRVGGKKNIAVDVRIIAATNRNLLQESVAGHFRQDLYYRLNVLSLQLPPLRERKGDVILLVKHFLKRMEQRYNRGPLFLTSEAQDLLQSYSWPGNIRELQNVIERAVVLSKESVIDAHAFHSLLPAQLSVPSAPVGSQAASFSSGDLSDERDEILRVLEECRWNVSKAAVRLNVARSTLYRKMYYYNLR